MSESIQVVGLLGTLIERCNSYLRNGGFFNPEMMDHQKVGTLLLDVRDFLAALLPVPPQAHTVGDFTWCIADGSLWQFDGPRSDGWRMRHVPYNEYQRFTHAQIAELFSKEQPPAQLTVEQFCLILLSRIPDEGKAFGDGAWVCTVGELKQLAALPPAQGWQPISTAPKDRLVWFWLAPKTAEETYCDTSGKPIVAEFIPFAQRTKHGHWSSLTKAVYWHEDTIPAPPVAQGWQPQEALVHPAPQVYFRAGLLACREYMARFVEAESPSIAMSIRANWWPSLGKDYGPPRKLEWSEATRGEFGTDSFHAAGPADISPTQEALPIALAFLESPLPAPPVTQCWRAEKEKP